MLNIFCNIAFLILFNLISSFAFASDRSIIIQSTTSLKNSGFYDYILPIILNDTGIKAKIVAVGSGAAIRNSMNCDGDILIVHSPKKEKIIGNKSDNSVCRLADVLNTSVQFINWFNPKNTTTIRRLIIPIVKYAVLTNACASS